MIFGGHIADFKPPFKRKFDDKRRKRKITFTIMQYISDAKHYYVLLEEESNPFWDTEEETWRECWDDKDAKGFREEEKFNTAKSAEDWIDKIKRKYKNHKFEYEQYCQWEPLYSHEGD